MDRTIDAAVMGTHYTCRSLVLFLVAAVCLIMVVLDHSVRVKLIRTINNTTLFSSGNLNGRIPFTRKEVNLSACLDTKFMPPGSMPYILLVSSPGSGNTWVRHLIERVTGIYTGSVLNDKTLYTGGFQGQLLPGKSGQVVIVKSHLLQDTEDKDVAGIVLLMRNPYDAMIAEYNRRISHGNHTGLVPAEMFQSKDWKTFVSTYTEKWSELNMGCLSTTSRVLIVYYEDLVNSLSNELERLVDFLGLRLDNERLLCTLRNTEGNFHRPRRPLAFDPFTSNMKTIMNEFTKNVASLIEVQKQNPIKLYERE